MNQGLNQSDIVEKLRIHGYNELPSSKPRNVGQIALEVVREPMFILLLSCSLLYVLLGDFAEGFILMGSIFIIIFITFYQHRKTEKALDALKKLSSPRALVIRNGQEFRIPGREVVPGDIIIINEGDRIPADANLIESVNLMVDESVITGESVPVRKEPGNIQADISDRLISGTLVVRGTGIAQVTDTGINTKLGKIGTSIHLIEVDQTRLQKEMKLLIKNLFIIGIFISLLVILSFYFTRGNFIMALLNGLAASIAILPEEFYVVLTVFLALGAWRLSKNNVLTRKPSAIETLGSATILCSDKTGTITQNKMEVAALYNGTEIFFKQNFHARPESISELIRVAHRASPSGSIDPMEKAISRTRELLSEIENEQLLLKEYPLSPELLAMTRVLESVPEKSLSVSAKGAPEAIFRLCKMGESMMAEHMKVVQILAEQGLRVIAVASSLAEGKKLPEHQHQFDFTFLGLIGLEDPIRPEVPEAIKQCMDAGIRVMMITGDFPATARSIAKQIGLPPGGLLISGDELSAMADDEIKEKIKTTTVFARVLPEQKLRIVKALKANNEIVAMTGDGVNDAPALKAADIGIAMGNKGTDVAREASSLVLLDDNFASIVNGIRSGRKIFDNLQKAMSYILAIHIPIIGLTLIPSFVSFLPTLMLPLQIVFMELIIDPVCSIAFESEQEEKDIMKNKPRDPNKRFFGRRRIIGSILEGLLLLVMVLTVYYLSIEEGHSEREVRAISFSSLIIGNMALILSKLSKTRGIIAILREMNLPLILILSAALIMLFMIITIPVLQNIFNLDFPGYRHFFSAGIGAGCLILIMEAIKYVKIRFL